MLSFMVMILLGIYCDGINKSSWIIAPFLLSGTMPDNYEKYYGFTRFAMELNEIEAHQKELYCPTDSRFRPDQR